MKPYPLSGAGREERPGLSCSCFQSSMAPDAREQQKVI